MKKSILFLLLFIFFSAQSQDGFLDTSFNIGTGPDGNIYLMKQLSDGKILLGGQFTSYNGHPANKIARLNNDGTFDSTFNIGTGFDGDILNALIENDGKIVIVGMFGSYNGNPVHYIVRINSDGTIDPTFSTTSGFIMSIGSVSKQNNKYIISGQFNSINGNNANNITRLNYDGSSDLTFNSNGVTGTSAITGISNSIVQNDNKVMIVGTFNNCQNVSRNNIARLNADGTLDTTFNPGSGTNQGITSLAIQNDGKYIIGSNFSQFNGINKDLIARINTDGSLDTSFSFQTGFEIIATSIVIQNDGKLIVGGWLSSLGGNNHYLERLNNNGDFDPSFITGSNFNNSLNTISLQSDGKILVGGWFSSYNSISRNKIIRLNNPSFLSIIENTNLPIFLYPNPTKDFLSINLGSQNSNINEITIFDISGKILFKKYFSSEKNLQLDMTDYLKGIYLLEIVTNKGKTIQKIIKE